MDLAALNQLARRQLGLVTRPQAIALGVSERRWRHLHDAQVLVAIRPRAVVRQGVAATNPLRTLCDLGAVVPDAVSDALTRFMIAGFVRPDAVLAAVERHSARGRNGIVALRRALAELPLGSKPPDSVLEPAVADLLRRYGLPAARFHAVILGYEVDFHFDETPVILESDGWSTHGLDRDQFERDRERDAVLTAAGYVVCRFSWRQITERPGWTAERLRETLLRWAPGEAGIDPSRGVVD